MRGERQNQNQTRNNDLPRSRALGIIILMFALLLFQVGVFVFEKVFRGERQEAGQSAAASSAAASSAAASSAAPSTASGPEPALFQFDPNTICPDSLCLLGFSRKQAESIVKYRSKGGKFRKKEDFAKMYVVSEEKYAELANLIVIEENARPLGKATEKATKKAKERGKNAKVEGQRIDTVEVHGEKRITLVIDVNKADSAALVKLYGIGGYYARKIIDYRRRVGNFYTTEQLLEIDGIDSVRYAGFAKNIKVDPSDVKRFSLDTAGKHFLVRHPYIGAYAARGILLMREKFGVSACSLENLVNERIIERKTADKLWYYIE